MSELLVYPFIFCGAARTPSTGWSLQVSPALRAGSNRFVYDLGVYGRWPQSGN